MKKSLLLLGVIAALAISAPAYSQNIFMDVNGDGACTSADVLTSSSTSIAIWLDTTKNGDGSTATCVGNPTQGLRMYGYDLYLRTGGTGSVAFNSYVNSLAGYTLINALTSAGSDVGVGYLAPTGTLDGPWLVKLGTFGVTVSGTPTVIFVSENPNPTAIPSPVTGFGSECDGTVYANTVVAGIDFTGACGTASGTPTESTTWGKIKQLYR